MKSKAVWLLCVLGATALVSCHNEKSCDCVVSQKFVHKYGFDLSPEEWESREKDGQIITCLENGVILTNSYVGGVLHGDTTYSFPNSKLIQETDTYNEGILVKKVIYDEEGMPVREDAFDLDERRSSTLWNKEGAPLSIEVYEKDRLISGKYFKADNEIESIIEEGKGIRIKKDRNNLLISKDKIENGDLASRMTFHPEGTLQSISFFKNYVLDGEQKTFTPVGKLLMKMYWKEGRLDGTSLVYRNNNIYKEIPYENGKKQGIERHFNPDNGALLAEIHWQDHKRHGSSRYYLEDNTQVAWFYQGQPVTLKKFEMLEFRDEMLADLNENDREALQKTEMPAIE